MLRLLESSIYCSALSALWQLLQVLSPPGVCIYSLLVRRLQNTVYTLFNTMFYRLIFLSQFYCKPAFQTNNTESARVTKRPTAVRFGRSL